MIIECCLEATAYRCEGWSLRIASICMVLPVASVMVRPKSPWVNCAVSKGMNGCICTVKINGRVQKLFKNAHIFLL